MRKFFLKQCQSYISNAYIDTVFTLEEFDSVKEILNSDIIISTSDAIETDIPVIFVNQFSQMKILYVSFLIDIQVMK